MIGPRTGPLVPAVQDIVVNWKSRRLSYTNLGSSCLASGAAACASAGFASGAAAGLFASSGLIAAPGTSEAVRPPGPAPGRRRPPGPPRSSRFRNSLPVEGPRSKPAPTVPHCSRWALLRPHFSYWAMHHWLALYAFDEPVSRGPISDVRYRMWSMTWQRFFPSSRIRWIVASSPIGMSGQGTSLPSMIAVYLDEAAAGAAESEP